MARMAYAFTAAPLGRCLDPDDMVIGALCDLLHLDLYTISYEEGAVVSVYEGAGSNGRRRYLPALHPRALLPPVAARPPWTRSSPSTCSPSSSQMPSCSWQVVHGGAATSAASDSDPAADAEGSEPSVEEDGQRDIRCGARYMTEEHLRKWVASQAVPNNIPNPATNITAPWVIQLSRAAYHDHCAAHKHSSHIHTIPAYISSKRVPQHIQFKLRCQPAPRTSSSFNLLQPQLCPIPSPVTQPRSAQSTTSFSRSWLHFFDPLPASAPAPSFPASLLQDVLLWTQHRAENWTQKPCIPPRSIWNGTGFPPYPSEMLDSDGKPPPAIYERMLAPVIPLMRVVMAPVNKSGARIGNGPAFGNVLGFGHKDPCDPRNIGKPESEWRVLDEWAERRYHRFIDGPRPPEPANRKTCMYNIRMSPRIIRSEHFDLETQREQHFRELVIGNTRWQDEDHVLQGCDTWEARYVQLKSKIDARMRPFNTMSHEEYKYTHSKASDYLVFDERDEEQDAEELRKLMEDEEAPAPDEKPADLTGREARIEVRRLVFQTSESS
ncbi:MAG: hypothetical protein WDW38_000612 [Sanguina aurantia]